MNLLKKTMEVKWLHLAVIALVSIFMVSCEKDAIAGPKEGKQDVTFSFSTKTVKSANGSKANYNKADAKYILVTIKNAAGNVVYNAEKIELFSFGSDMISAPLALNVAVGYSVTAFQVLDASNKVIFATPLAGSPLAYLVSKPLPLSFDVTKNQVTKVVPEVISVEKQVPSDFGYASFDFNVVVVIKFLTNIQLYDETAKNWAITSGTVKVTAIPENINLYDKAIAAVTDTINVKDGYASYKVSVSKAGYITKDTTLTQAQLKTYAIAINNKPLLMRIKKDPVVINSIVFDGVNDEIDFGNLQFPTALENFTLEAWVYWTGGEIHLFDKNVNHSFFISSTGKMSANFGNNVNCVWQSSGFSSATSIPSNEWVHVAFSQKGYDGMDYYINGIFVGNTLGFHNINNKVCPSNLKMYTTSSAGNKIAEVRFWSTARTAQQINDNKAACFTTSEPNLWAYYKFDGPVGSTTLKDFGSLKWNGTLKEMDVNTVWKMENVPEGKCAQ